VLHSEALKIVAVLRAAYPSWKATDETEETWARFLEDLGYELVNAAVSRIVMNEEREFPPPLARIRRECAVLTSPSLAVTAEEAWAEVLHAVKTVGSYRKPGFSSPEIGQAVEALGWRELCLSQEGDSGIRAHFFRTFHAYQERAKESANLPEWLHLPREDRKQIDGRQLKLIGRR